MATGVTAKLIALMGTNEVSTVAELAQQVDTSSTGRWLDRSSTCRRPTS